MSSQPWFRLYAEFASDPVIQSLDFEHQRHFVVVLCLKCAGVLDRAVSGAARKRIILRGLGLDDETASETFHVLHEVGLIDHEWHPIAWEARQYKSDKSTDRVRKYRKNKKTGNVSAPFLKRNCNGPEADTDTDTEDNPPVSPPKGGRGKWELPDWIPAEAWKGYEEMRRRISKPMTDRARTLAVGKLDRLRHAGHPPAAVLDQSTLHSWQGLFELKADGPGNGHAKRTLAPHERVTALAEQRRREREDGQGTLLEGEVVRDDG